MLEFCTYAFDYLCNIPTYLIDECSNMPESCVCNDCPYYKQVEVSDE